MYFGFSPTAGAILALIFIVWLIGSGVKSAGKKLPTVDVADPMTLKGIRKVLGTTWKDELLGFIIFLFIAAIIASIMLRF